MNRTHSVHNSCLLLYFVVVLIQIGNSLSCMRSCPLGLYCPRDVPDCTSDTSKCVSNCFSYNATHQGNGQTGDCVDVSNKKSYWLDSSLYEVFAAHQMEPNKTISNISFIITYEYWNGISNRTDFLTNVKFNLISSSSYFILNDISITLDSFNDESNPEICKKYEMIHNSSGSIPLGDYDMEVQVVWKDNVLTNSDVIVHVVDPVPTSLPIPVTCVEFKFENYSAFLLNYTLNVTLVLSGQPQSESFDVLIIAKNTLFASSIPGNYIATFSPGSNTSMAVGIPLLKNEANKDGQIGLQLYIPSASYELGINKGGIKQATANVTDVKEVIIPVGQDIILPRLVRLVINCSDLIEKSSLWNVTWTRNNIIITNGSGYHAFVEQYNQALILSKPLPNSGAQIRSEGDYSCKVCTKDGLCTVKKTTFDICEVPRVEKGEPLTVIADPSLPVAATTCGTNLCITSKPIYIRIKCYYIGSSLNLTKSLYKNNVYRGNNTESFLLSKLEIPNHLGAYKVVYNNHCGMDAATSVLSLCEPLMIYFSAAAFNGSESSGSINVDLILEGDLSIIDGNITVIVISSDQSPLSAEGNGVDYTSTPITATFTADSTNTTINIPVAVDNIVEGTERFELHLSLPISMKYAVKLATPNRVTAAIIDASNSSVMFSDSAYTVKEIDGHMQANVTLSNPASFDITINIVSKNSTAIGGGVDYDSGPYTVTFSAGVTSVQFDVPIIDDDIYEPNEEFYLTLTPELLPDNVFLEGILETKIIIDANDDPSVTFSQTTYSVDEDDGPAQPVLVLSNPSSTNITVQVITSDVTAKGNIDYIPGPYNVTFPAGAAIVPFDVVLIIKNTEETIKEFNISIIPSSGLSSGSYNSALVTIIGRNVKYCQQTEIRLYGWKIIWPRAPAGKILEMHCIRNRTGLITRRCGVDGKWEAPVVGCANRSFNDIISQLENAEQQSCQQREAQVNEILQGLDTVTAPQSLSHYPNELKLTTNILTRVNDFIVNCLRPNDTILKASVRVINNLLSDTNEEGWLDLQQVSLEVQHRFVRYIETLGRALTELLTVDAPVALETEKNIAIKTELTTKESINSGKSLSFPNSDDDMSLFGGHTTRVMLPNGLFRSMLNNLPSDTTDVRVSYIAFRNLSLILPPISSNSSNKSSMTSVISIQLPDPLTIDDGDDPITLTFEVDDKPKRTTERNCVFYDFDLESNGFVVGGWSTEGVMYIDDLSNDSLITCHSTHLTSFAVLVSPQDERPPSPEDKALSIISYIGCSISLFFLLISVIILSYLLYRRSRGKRNLLVIHLNLCVSLALGLLVFLIGIETATNNKGACKFVAALLQYLFTSAFCWMLCEGVMLYMMLVTVFGNKLNHYLFFLALGWGPAIPIVAISVGIAHEQYGTEHYCWIKSDKGAIAAFIAPIVAIILVNCVFFAIAFKVIYKTQTMDLKSGVASQQQVAKEVMKGAVFLLPLLGMTWIIGIFAINNETQVFAWIFAILNSLQGLFIFVFHIARNREVNTMFHRFKNRHSLRREGSSFYSKFYGSRRSTISSTSTCIKERGSQNSSIDTSRHQQLLSTDSDVFISTVPKCETDFRNSIIEEKSVEQTTSIEMTAANDDDKCNAKEEEVNTVEENNSCDREKGTTDKAEDTTAPSPTNNRL